MQLNLKGVFSGEEKLQKEYTINMQDFTWDGRKPFTDPVKIKVFAESSAGAVRLSLSAEFDFTKPCDRCFTDTTKHYSMEFVHTVVGSLSGDYNDEYIEAPNFILDLLSLVQSDILLELPHKFLCNDSCKGLCSKCGSNLNITGCSCNKAEIDPRLEALKQLLE